MVCNTSDNRKCSNNSRLSAAVAYTLATAIPIVIIIGILWQNQICPFGERTLVEWDLKVTYTYYYEWMRNVFSGDASLLYSFGKSLGGNMFAAFTSLCASPFLLLLPIIPDGNVVLFVSVMITGKFGLAGLTSQIFLRHRFSLPVTLSVALSVCFAFMMFMLTQCPNPMWLDAVYMLPLMMLGIYWIVRRGRMVFFFVTLLLTILFSWYNGYMACLFAMLYYIFESIIFTSNAKGQGLHIWLGVLVRPGRFSIAFTLAVIASFIILLPTAQELLLGKGGYDTGPLFDSTVRYSALHFPSMLLLGVCRENGYPQLYTGMFVLAATILFLFNPRIAKRERIAGFLLLSILALSTWWAPLDRIWCGFRDGNAFYCRFTYLFSGVMVFCSAAALEQIDRQSSSYAVVSLVFILIACFGARYANDFAHAEFFYVAVGLSCAFCALLLAYGRVKERRSKNTLSVIVLLLVIAEGAYVANWQIGERAQYDEDGFTAERYEQYFGEGQRQFDELDANDGTEVNAYRVSKTYMMLSPSRPLASNESLVFGYSQMSTYDSTYDDAVQNFVSSMGYTVDESCRTTYIAPILTTDSLLGIRYVSTDKRPAGFRDAGFDQTQDGNRFYENPCALPLGFGVNSAAIEETLELSTDLSVNDDSHNPFENQNKLLQLFDGVERTYFTAVEWEQVTRSAEEVSWIVHVPENKIVYAFIPGNAWMALEMSIDGDDYSPYMNQWAHGVVEISDAGAARDVRLVLRTLPKGSGGFEEIPETEATEIQAYALDLDAFFGLYNALSARPFEISVFEDGRVAGSYKTDEDGWLFTTIPYDSGWRVKVNGEVVEAVAAQDTFLAIPVHAGENNIEMTFFPPWLKAGFFSAVVALILFTISVVLLSRKDRRAKRTSE